MAASTITRATWTNDSGTPAAPVGDGTVLANVRLQNDVYAKIDEMFAGAGTYATFTFGGKFAAEGFGSHTFTAGGVGANLVRIRNTTAGVGNFASVQIQADSAATDAGFGYFSTTYTSAADIVADGARLYSGGAGGLSLSASNVAGAIRFYSGGTTERARLTTGGMFCLNDTSNAKMTQGITINQGGADDEILCLKSTDVAHGMTGQAEADTYCTFQKGNVANGGFVLSGFSADILAANIYGFITTETTTKSNTSTGAIHLVGQTKSGTSFAAMGANANVVSVSSNSTTGVRFILDADGDSHQDVGTAWTNFDDHDDVALLTALSGAVSRKDDPLRDGFASWLTTHRDTLVRNGVVTINDHAGGDGSVFINWSRTHMLLIGAIRQLGGKVAELQTQLRALEA